MKHSVLLMFLPLALFAETPAATPAKPAIPAATSGDPVVMTVGTEKITRSQFESIVATLPETERAKLSDPVQRRTLAKEIAGMEALAVEARARKIDRTPAVQEMLRMQTDSVLANALVRQQMATDHAGGAALRQYYDQHKGEFEEVKASHILIRFQGSQVPLRPNQKDLSDAEALAKAQEIRAKLEKGGDFAALAKAESDDTGSGAQGGELPQAFGRDAQLVAEFKEAAFQLKPGEISQPVKTQFGYHIIKVTSHTTKTFDQAQPQIEQQVARAFVETVKKQVPQTFDEGYFGKE